MDVSAAIQEVTSDAKQGLSAAEASLRYKQYGPNELSVGKKRGPLRMFFGQFTDFMIVVLLTAAIVSALVGGLKDAIAILAILVINAIIGFVQEYRAEKAMEALKAMAAPTASLIREGKTAVLAAREIVPGDVVLLEAGRIVPSDLRLIESARLKVDESALTGESVPVEKITEPVEGDSIPLGDRKNMAYKGTIVTYGRGSGVVVATGMTTEFGKIATMLQGTPEVKTPLQKRLAHLGKRLSVAALFICAAVFVAGILRGESLILMFMTAVSLAVAAIPESLPAVVTISLALGAKKIAQKKALVRKLPAVETLGSVTYICTDKTGTLTLNRMKAEVFFCGGVVEKEPKSQGPWNDFLKAMALCNDSSIDSKGIVVGDPTETALLEAAARGGVKKSEIEKTYPRVLEIPFDSDRKRMTTFHKSPEGHFISFTKGAVEAIDPKPEILAAAEKMAGEGLRVLAFGMKKWDALPAEINTETVERDLTFLGLVGLMDPPREEARLAVDKCKTAGIAPVMITGDHPGTARAIAERLGILEKGAEVMTGTELAKISMEEFEARVKGIRVYARVSPDQKLKIVTALQDKGEFVAMTGDGVNDAPALKKADIGVAMGITGTDVAKEASSMILLDDNFATIVRAVEEGRRIYDNMRRFIRYAVTTNSAEVWIIFFAPFLGLPIPFIPIQILWINLLTDGLPGLALAAEPAEKNVMRRPPRSPREGVFAQGLGIHVIWVGLLMAALTLGAEAWLIRKGVDHWQSIIFTTLCVSQLAHVLSIRSETESLFRQGLFTNKPLLYTVLFTFFLQMCTLYVPLMNDIFKTKPLTAMELVVVCGLSSTVFFAVEIEKWIKRSRLRLTPDCRKGV